MEIVPEMTQMCKLAEFYCSPTIADILDRLCTDESAEKVNVLAEKGRWKRVKSRVTRTQKTPRDLNFCFLIPIMQ